METYVDRKTSGLLTISQIKFKILLKNSKVPYDSEEFYQSLSNTADNLVTQKCTDIQS